MSNPNNLLRPSALGQIPPNAPANPSPIAPPNPPPNAIFNNQPGYNPLTREQRTAMIAEISLQVLNNNAPAVVQVALNPNASLANAVDQQIYPQRLNDLADLDKIPDIVKTIREFSGNPVDFSSWKKSVDRVLKIFESTRGTPRYYGILSTVRNKIVDIALEAYPPPLDWAAISRCLNLHYADKRDISTLEY